MQFEVTGTCYPEAQVLSGIVEGFLEMEFNKQVTGQKEKLTEISTNMYRELAALVAIERNLIPVGRSEITLKERYLEAVTCEGKTVKEVCLQVHPEAKGSREKERAMKSTSMFLMRLFKEKLVHREPAKAGYEYRVSIRGLKRLLFYRKAAAGTGRKRELHDQIEKIVKLNDQLVPDIEQMRGYNAEAMKKLEHADLAMAVHQTYGGIVRMLTLEIIALQRAFIKDDDDSKVKAVCRSTMSLLKLGNSEATVSDILQMILENQKWLKDRIRKADIELREIEERTSRYKDSMVAEAKMSRIFLELLKIRFRQET